jgi:hypothetical protein
MPATLDFAPFDADAPTKPMHPKKTKKAIPLTICEIAPDD